MIYLLHGENSYQSWSAYLELKQEFLNKNIQIESRDDEYMLSHDIFFDSNDLFGTERVFFLRHIWDLPVARRDVFFQKIMSLDGVDVVIWENKKVDKRTTFFKFIKKKGIEREYQNLKYAEYNKWLKNTLQSYKLDLTQSQINTLNLRTNQNMWLVHNEVQKLASFAKLKGVEALDQEFDFLVSNTAQFDIWKFVDSFFSHRFLDVFDLIETTDFEDSDVHLVVGALQSQLRLMYLLSQDSERNVAEVFGIHPFRIQKTREILRTYKTQKIKEMYHHLLNADYAIKIGELDPKTALTVFVAKTVC